MINLFGNSADMKDLKKIYKIKATPPEVYAALTNPFSIEIWTGEEAVMSTRAGEEFSLYSGDISGKNLQFEQDRKIIQEWYFGEQKEPSIVTITLAPDKYFTRIELLHTNIPDEAFEDMNEGWDESYFGSLKEFFD
jgi:activator of HSP90 ATPase